MQTIFGKLRVELDATDRWLAELDGRPLKAAERRLVTSLREYIRHCRTPGRRWPSAAEAGRVITKVGDAWQARYFRVRSR